jgi:oxygen-independent coproporphyrinogen-3 oxidase
MNAIATFQALPDVYTAYAYSYPHKSSYRALRPPVPLADAWRDEDRHSLFLYLHMPFCEMRCGFCNLFAAAQPPEESIGEYLTAVERQANVVREAIGEGQFTRMAVGGGTPTYLSPPELHRLFDIAQNRLAVDPHAVPASVETSPATADQTRLNALRERGISRISIGVQSFVEDEARALGRPQRSHDVYAALDRIRATGFPSLNIDLIFGIKAQTTASLLFSVTEALRYRPEEVFLYPLYVRPQTGLASRPRNDARPDSMHVLTLYRSARDALLSVGYVQVSLRCFRWPHAPPLEGPAYCCQRDGMVGLGCGARSYTSRLHYASHFAVDRAAVWSILRRWIAQPDQEFALASYGFALSQDERSRRYLILSLLQSDGLNAAEYERLFGARPVRHFPLLNWLVQHGLALAEGDRLRLTRAGLELSDAIGPALYSPTVRAALEKFVQL